MSPLARGKMCNCLLTFASFCACRGELLAASECERERDASYAFQCQCKHDGTDHGCTDSSLVHALAVVVGCGNHGLGGSACGGRFNESEEGIVAGVSP